MSCFRPNVGFMKDGKVCFLSGRLERTATDVSRYGKLLEIPCGKCIGCKMERARMWSVRICHEASLFDSNRFVTFTYEDKYLPPSLSLVYPDFQLFMKRLRKEYRGHEAGPSGRYPIRFFVAGEYGSQYRRPHWHAIFFNLVFPDEVKFHNETFRSEAVESLWGKGNCVIGSVTAESAAYVAGYTLYKKGHVVDYEDVVNPVTGELSGRRPEFVVMSRRPGIGAWWYEKFKGDLFPVDTAVMYEGRKQKVPRFYYEKYKDEDPDGAEKVARKRRERALLHPEEGTEERLAIREEYAEGKFKSYKERVL